MKVLWGSQTGTATGFAEELAKEATSKGLPTTSIDLRKYVSVSLMLFRALTHINY